jgi:hypothetical protein
LFLKPSHAGGFKGYALDYSLPLPYPLLHTSMLNHPLSLSFLANHTFLFHLCQSPKSKANPYHSFHLVVSSITIFNQQDVCYHEIRCMLWMAAVGLRHQNSLGRKIESVDGFMVGTMQEQTGSGHKT